MDDAGPGRDDPQVAERGLRPAQELVALAVALVLALDVEGERIRRPEPVDVDRVVDDEVGRDERVDHGRIAAELGHRVAHDRQVDDGRHAGQVLEDHARGHERDLGLGGARPAATRPASRRRPGRRSRRRHGGARSRAGSGSSPAAPASPVRSTEGRQAVQVREARAERRAGAEWVDPLTTRLISIGSLHSSCASVPRATHRGPDARPDRPAGEGLGSAARRRSGA